MMKNLRQLVIPTSLLSLLLAAGVVEGAEKQLLVQGELTPALVRQPHPRMTSEFYYLVQNLKGKSATSRAQFTKLGLEALGSPLCRLKGANNELIETYVWLDAWTDEYRQGVLKAGAELTGEDPSRYLMQVWIPLDEVEKFASLPGVRHLRRPSYGVASSGAILTAGDINLNTNFIRSLGRVDGTGVDVGVLSSGLFVANTGIQASIPASSGVNRDVRIQTRDIPPRGAGPGPTSSFFGNIEIFPSSFALHELAINDVVTGLPGIDFLPIADGAAILETLYDIAPGARFFYGDGTTDVNLQSSRQYLISRGVDVIVDDMVFYDSGRYDGTSAISRRAQQIVFQNNIAYVAASGNFTTALESGPSGLSVSANRSPIFVNSYFSPRPGITSSKFHNFAVGSTPSIRDESLTVRPQNGLLDVIIVWDDNWDDQSPRATDDLDLFLLNVGSLSLTSPVASSTDIQAGFGRPIERITFPDPTGQSYSLVISRKDVTNSAPTLFSLVILRGIVDTTDVKYLTHGIAGNNGDALPPVITVGAIDAVKGIANVAEQSVPGVTPGPGRSFDNDFVKWFTTQSSPSVVSYSNTDTLTTRFSSVGSFTGSSAGAAHIGGLMTLLRAKYPQIPAWDYYQILRDTSVPADLPFPTATRIIADQLLPYKNAPIYLRVNGYDAFANIGLSLLGGRNSQALLTTSGDVIAWESVAPPSLFFAPHFTKTTQGLSLSPGGRNDVFGFWQTPLLEFLDEDGSMRSELRSDHLYVLKARVGSDESDPTRVPDFRLRLTSGGSDESSLLVIAGLNQDAANAPTTIGGKEYTVYYRPSNDEVARQGVRFAFDLIHFDPNDNANATLYLQDVSFEEQQLP